MEASWRSRVPDQLESGWIMSRNHWNLRRARLSRLYSQSHARRRRAWRLSCLHCRRKASRRARWDRPPLMIRATHSIWPIKLSMSARETRPR